MKKGFTLIELLITMTIFSIVVTGFLGLFASAFKAQRRDLNLQYLLQNTSYISEYVTRALRMARKDLSGNCITAKYNFENPGGQIFKIRFLNYQERCQEFVLENNQLKIGKSATTAPPDVTDFMTLTPSNLIVENLKFKIFGETQEDTLQPKVTFTLKIKNEGVDAQTLNLQTTISQRELDVKY